MVSLEINIWGEKMKISSDQNEAFIIQVANYLNEKMKEVQQSDDAELSTKIVALRTAYRIAAEFLMARNEAGRIETALNLIEEKFAKSQP